MPSGLTCEIGDGQTFEEFVWRCARAMGALIHMREDGTDVRLTLPKADDWHEKHANEARLGLDRLRHMSDDEAEKKALADYKKDIRYYEKYLADKERQRTAYEAMLAKVEAWQPPTPDHENFKKMMRDQITESIKWDCDVRLDPPKLVSGAEWREQRIEVLRDSLAYHLREDEAEHRRAKERRAWVLALAESVPIPEKLRPL